MKLTWLWRIDMRLPKLKYYYYAMSSDAYIDFAVKRKLTVDATLSIDVLTGKITGTTILVLADSTTAVDEHFRAAHAWTKPVYVLRIPADLIDRKYLKRATEHLYEYKNSLTIEHCGVERFELADSLA
jgi:hypothetical protein